MVESTSLVRRYSHQVIVGAPHLLDMWYTPSELAEELDLSPRTVRDWTHGDMPHQTDEAGRLWIHGIQFAVWVNQVRTQRPKFKLQAGEGYCLKCKRAVKILGPQESQVGKAKRLTGRCPHCDSVVYRGVRRDQPK